jgi:hypothetical protein
MEKAGEPLKPWRKDDDLLALAEPEHQIIKIWDGSKRGSLAVGGKPQY